MSQKQHSGFKIYPYGIEDLSLPLFPAPPRSISMFMADFSANFLLITLMMVLLRAYAHECSLLFSVSVWEYGKKCARMRRQRIKWNQNPTHALCMCVVAQTTSSLVEKLQKCEISSQHVYRCESCMIPTRLLTIKQLMTEGKVNGNPGKEQQTFFFLL